MSSRVFLDDNSGVGWMNNALRSIRFSVSSLGVGSHGVPSPNHPSKSQHGGKVPIFEPHGTIKI